MHRHWKLFNACLFPCHACASTKPKKFKDEEKEEKLCNSQKSVYKKFYVSQTIQPILFVFVVLLCMLCSGCNMHILLCLSNFCCRFVAFRFDFVVNCFCASSCMEVSQWVHGKRKNTKDRMRGSKNRLTTTTYVYICVRTLYFAGDGGGGGDFQNQMVLK